MAFGQRRSRRPIDRGFDRFYGLLDGCCNFFDPTIPDPKFKGGRVRVFAENEKRITEFPDDFYTTDAFSDHAVKFVRDVADSDKPFFLHVCYTAPHYPLHALPEDIARYKGKYLQGWDALRKQRHKRQIEMGLIDARWQAPARDAEAEAWSEAQNKDWQDLRMAVYAAMIDRMDQGVGRILAQLEDSGIADNTLVMFLSDNGGCAETPGGNDPHRIPGPKEYYTHCGPGWAYAQNTPFRRYKQWVHEGGISTPFIVRWPGRVEPNTMCNDVAHIIDLLPTCADVGGAKYPETHDGNEILPLDGLSMTPILDGNTRNGHKSLCWEWAGSRAVRIGNMKLCWDRAIRKWELYDVLDDRTETNDLAADRPEVVRSMSETWLAWARETGVNVKTGNSKKQKTKKKN